MGDSPALLARAYSHFFGGCRGDVGDKERQPLLGAGGPVEDASPLLVFCFVVNSCIGVGFLSLPRAFDKAGLVWASVLTVVMGFITLSSSSWVVHSMSNTEALLRYLAVVDQGGDTELAKQRPSFDISNRRNELSQMVGLLLGKGWKTFYMVVMAYLMYSTMWVFGSVFAASLAAKVSLPFSEHQFTCDLYKNQTIECKTLYLEYLLVFALIVIPASIVELKEQTWFQVLMSIVRFVLIAALVADSARILLSGEAPPNFYHYDATYHPVASGMVDFEGTRDIIGILVFALMVQMMIPTTAQPLRNKRDNLLPTVWSALFFCAFVYLLVGLCVALVFGHNTLPVASLNWRHFTAGNEVAPHWAQIFSTVLILFPTLDVLSAYPLVAFCLGENLAAMLPARFHTGIWPMCCRLLAALPPLVGAMFVTNVTTLFEWGAVGAWLLLVFFPALCLLRSQQYCEERFGKGVADSESRGGRNPYATWLSSKAVVYAVVGISIVLYVVHIGSFVNHKMSQMMRFF